MGETGGAVAMDTLSEEASFSRALEENPFVLPPDEEVFKMRDEEKRRKKEERARAKTLSVQDKVTFNSRTSYKHAGPGPSGADSRRTKRGASIGAPGDVSGGGSGGEGELGVEGLPPDQRRRSKENMTDFIAKKREIFLVQMSIDTKRAEIRKLEERALQREEALRKSEQMLEEDALRFDAFLKENDEKVQEAIKRAEVEAKAKQDKVAEIKRLNAAISTIRSELNKYEEQLEDCRKYKAFLDSLTPAEWFEEQEELKAARRTQREENILAERERAMRECAEDEEREEAASANARGMEYALGDEERAERQQRLEAAVADMRARGVDPSELDGESVDGDGEDEMAMYFKEPQQLLDVFAQLEEQNLFLIQNCQETEEALEDLQAKYHETKTRMDSETDALSSQIELLELAIKQEEDKGKALENRARESGDASGRETTLEELSAKVAQVYVQCGFDSDASIGTLQMLTNIEARLEEYLSIVDTMDEEFVASAEKEKEKERRERMRKEKLEQQRRELERRMKRSLERAQAPVQKKVGKPVMFRSYLPERKKRVDKSVDKAKKEEEELLNWLSQEF